MAHECTLFKCFTGVRDHCSFDQISFVAHPIHENNLYSIEILLWQPFHRMYMEFRLIDSDFLNPLN